MKYLDWQAILFVGMTLFQEYWIHYRLPQIQYWEAYQAIIPDDADDENKAA